MYRLLIHNKLNTESASCLFYYAVYLPRSWNGARVNPISVSSIPHRLSVNVTPIKGIAEFAERASRLFLRFYDTSISERQTSDLRLEVTILRHDEYVHWPSTRVVGMLSLRPGNI
jgi:hypothetical protein